MQFTGILVVAAAATLVGCASESDSVTIVAPAASVSGVPADATVPTATAAYVNEATAGDLFEIRAAEVAMRRPTSPQVRQFAERMFADHTRSTRMIEAAADEADLAINPPSSLDSRREAMVGALEAASDGEFERLYLHQQLRAHEAALDLQRNYADSGEVAPLRTVASQIVPIVQSHLEMLHAMGAV